ncbi:MAG: hypothetical protein Q9180_007565 [Flavoplaca navasiana]
MSPRGQRHINHGSNETKGQKTAAPQVEDRMDAMIDEHDGKDPVARNINNVQTQTPLQSQPDHFPKATAHTRNGGSGIPMNGRTLQNGSQRNHDPEGGLTTGIKRKPSQDLSSDEMVKRIRSQTSAGHPDHQFTSPTDAVPGAILDPYSETSTDNSENTADKLAGLNLETPVDKPKPCCVQCAMYYNIYP